LPTPVAGSNASLVRMAEDCIFCKIVAGEIPAYKIAEDEHTITFMDIAPATRGHALVIPKKHATDIWEIEPDEFAHVAEAARQQAKRVQEKLDANGCNLINSCGQAAWQTVFHLHVHVIPRYLDDPLKLPWVPASGDMDEIAAAAQQLR
jgi:histidine triad (HIT) family protein